MRLQKYMADSGIASRRKCEEYITAGMVTVNGDIATLGMSVNDGDEVRYNGKTIAPVSQRVVIMLNKPAGMVCTASDPEGRSTIMDCFKDFKYRLYNVGRLDYDSEGLLIMTNDGELAYRMTHPKFIIDKTYYAVCSGRITAEQIASLEQGVDIGDCVTSPANVRDVHKIGIDKSCFFITIHEGRNRQIRRMISAIGYDTLLLRRVRVGRINLGELKPGEWRYLTTEELTELDTMLVDTDEAN
ncbi:MAG: pseudouridine synthase [Clostridia bacterium]